MSSKPLMLEGRVDERDALIESLQQEIRELTLQLREAQSREQRTRHESTRAVTNLRRQLTPLYQALQAVFGEMEAIGGEEGAASSVPQGKKEVWDAWKSRLGGAASKIIDALLTHGELNTQQLSIVTGLHRTTVPNGVSQLNKAGLINKRDGKFSLKAL